MATIECLKERRDFLAAANRGRKHAAPGLVLQALARGDGSTAVRVGFTVTKKLGNAVVRNRIRRRLRAVAAEILPDHAAEGHDLVLIGRAATRTRDYQRLGADLHTALKKTRATALEPARAPAPEAA